MNLPFAHAFSPSPCIYIPWSVLLSVLLLNWEKCFAGGALKPTDVEMLWVHVTCAWFKPQVVFQNHEAMEPALGILRIPPNTFVKVKR